MKGRILNIVLVLVLATLPMTANAGWSEAQQVTDQTLPAPSLVEETPTPDTDFLSSPVMAIENVGQWNDGARFQVWGGPAGTMWLAEDAIWITVLEPGQEETSRQVDKGPDPALRWSPQDREDFVPRRGVNIKLSFVAANRHPRIETFDRLDTTVSYFYGNDPDQWRPDVPVWGGVRYEDLYPGIDLEVTNEDGRMVQRLAARPGADLAAVQVRVEGADAVTVDGDRLHLNTVVGELTLPLLQAPGSTGEATVQPRGERLFDVSTPLAALLPPSPSPVAPAENPADLLYSTFLGGSYDDFGTAIGIDGAGSAYVTGGTRSSDFPTTPGAFDPSHNSGYNAFVAKLNSGGSGLTYATFLGGSFSGLSDIAVDGAGNAYIAGTIGYSNFPITPDAFDSSYNGGWDGFVAKLDPSGSGLAYATFLGGSGDDYVYAVAVDTEGSAYVTGYTGSSNFPTTPGAFDGTFGGGTCGYPSQPCPDAFVIRLNPAGSGLAYATFLGSSSWDQGYRIALDGTGSAYVTGYTISSDFPTTPGAFDTSQNGSSDAFVVKLNPAGSELVFSTFLGGHSADWGYGIAVDAANRAYVTGSTCSVDFPTTPGAFDISHNGYTGGCYVDYWGHVMYHDGWVIKLNQAGSSLTYGTYLGGSNTDWGKAIAVDSAGSAYVIGFTLSGNLPTTPDAFDPIYNGDEDAFVIKLNPAGSELAYGSYLGGSSRDQSFDIALSNTGLAYMTGYTGSSGFPTTSGAFDRSFNGGFNGFDAFVAKLALGPPLPFDAAELASQSEYLTVAPGAAISPWIVVRNTGTTTWTPAQYGYNGRGALQGWTGYITRNVAPSDTYRFFWNLNAPTTPGVYDYGFMLRHGTQEFGPYFFVRVTVIGYTISGRVVDTNGGGISGVTVRADSSHAATTDSAGNYTLSGLLAGIYTVQPSKNGYAFCPVNRRVNLSSNVAGQNFTGFGATVALGFCPNVNGYNFPNWGRGLLSADDYRDTELIRMFGQDKVCVMAGPICFVKPQATLWLRGMNLIMNFGHCDGMASTSLRFFKGRDIPQTFNPNASTAHGLDLEDVRHHIAYYMVEQFTEPVSSYKDQVLQNTLAAILDQLRAAMQGGADPTILFLRMAGEGGHTITPYAIEDKGNGVSWVRVYDNNHPDDFTRYVIIDTVNQSWSYRAGATTVWTGDRTTKTLGVIPISKYAEQPRPPWWDGSLHLASPDTPSTQEVLFNGSGHLLITDAQGRRLGYSGTQFVSEIPGAYGGFVDGGLGVEQEPIYKLPVSGGYTILVDGQTAGQPANATISQFGPGYAAQVENVRLQPSVRDSITIGADGRQITYQPNSSRNPTLSLALDDAAASYELGVVGAEIDTGQRVTAAAQESTGRLVYSNAQASGGDYGLFVRRVSSSGVQLFAHNDLTISSGDTHYADYRNWNGRGSMTLQIDRGSNGTIDETVPLENQIRSVYLPKVVGN